MSLRFIKSLLNLNVDYSGNFFYGIKRYRAARKFLANLNLLNRVRPRELADFMIQRRKLPYSKTGRLLILRRAFNLTVGGKQGSSKALYKRLRAKLRYVTQQRQDYIIRLFVCKLDLFTYNLRLFESVLEARKYIKTCGVFINNILVYNPRRILKALDIISFLPEHRYFFKARFYYFFSSSLLFYSYYETLSRVFANLINYKQNLFNFNFTTSGFGNARSHEALTGAGQSDLTAVKCLKVSNGLFRLLGAPSYPKKLVAFALAFKRRKWVRRWRDLQVGHPENLKRLLGHSLSVNPYALDVLTTRLVKRVRRVCSREFWYFFPKFKKKINNLKLSLDVRETPLVRLKRYRYLRHFRKKKTYRRLRYTRFTKGSYKNTEYTSDIRCLKTTTGIKKRRYHSKKRLQGIRGCFVRLFFEKDFIRSFVRILSWRFRKLRFLALLSRLNSRVTGFNQKSTCFTRLLSVKSVFNSVIFESHSFSSTYSTSSIHKIVPQGSLVLSKASGFFNFSFFTEGFLRRVVLDSGSFFSLVSNDFITKKAVMRFGFRKYGSRYPRFRKVMRKVVCFPKSFAHIAKMFPPALLNTLTRIPWYERLPFSRSKFFRFYRLHPRYSSIFFPNFLPRFVEPSLKAFEFLIRPFLLRPSDLRLPFKVRKGVRLNLLMSLV